ncbi:hypothetical protein TNCV_3846301 [Trichonephila clavipes]|nr:hypothetical protein TNCV_3846301 [Trichonephila clavipes]
MDQIMSFLFRDCLQQVIQVPQAHTQKPQVLDTVSSLFDESNDLSSLLDHFETGLAREHEELPTDLIMHRLKRKVKRATDFKVINPLDLSLHNCFLSCILHSSRRRIREMVDLVGRLGNASRQQRSLAHVGLQPWKLDLEKHVQRSHDKALANGIPHDVTHLEHI